MRITAGQFRSRNIKTLKSDVSRPTSDKVRQAIFSRVGPYFQKSTFLDVFGGSGAMGLEALSRGMSEVVCIEKDPAASRLILENAKAFDVMNQMTLYKGDVLVQLKKINQKFDYIFIDPPYAYPKFEEVIQYVVDHLSYSHSEIIVESDSDKDLSDRFGNFVCVQSKKYGHTQVRYYEMSDENE